MSRKNPDAESRVHSNVNVLNLKINRCCLCGKGFKSRSQYDALCDLCWADNEMRPYVTRTRGYRGTGRMN